jgi:hypothetical protein
MPSESVTRIGIQTNYLGLKLISGDKIATSLCSAALCARNGHTIIARLVYLYGLVGYTIVPEIGNHRIIGGRCENSLTTGYSG